MKIPPPFFALLVLALPACRQKANNAERWPIEDFGGDARAPLSSLGWEEGRESNGKYDYALATEGGETFLRGTHLRGSKGRIIYKKVDWDCESQPWLSWRWRARVFPRGARVLEDGRSDAAAQVYVAWREFGRNSVLKYFWASDDPEGASFSRSNFFLGRLYGLVLRSGGRANVWQSEARNVREDYQHAFGSLPPRRVRAIGILVDADDTNTQAESDFDAFLATRERP